MFLKRELFERITHLELIVAALEDDINILEQRVRVLEKPKKKTVKKGKK